MGTQTFKITKVKNSTRVQRFDDATIAEDTVFNKCANYSAANNSIIIHTKQEPFTDYTIPFSEIVDKLGATTAKEYIDVIEKRGFFDSNVTDVTDLTKAVAARSANTTILKGFHYLKIELLGDGTVATVVEVDGVPYPADEARVIEFTADQSSSDVVITPNANTFYVTEIR